MYMVNQGFRFRRRVVRASFSALEGRTLLRRQLVVSLPLIIIAYSDGTATRVSIPSRSSSYSNTNRLFALRLAPVVVVVLLVVLVTDVAPSVVDAATVLLDTVEDSVELAAAAELAAFAEALLTLDTLAALLLLTTAALELLKISTLAELALLTLARLLCLAAVALLMFPSIASTPTTTPAITNPMMRKMNTP
jgi:hypothetical protein